MSTKPAQQEAERPGGGNPTLGEFFALGRESTDAMLCMQKELLEACEHASRAWLSRVRREANLWSKLANELMTIGAAPRALSDCQNEMTRRMQAATEDGRRMAEDIQKAVDAMVRSASITGRPPK